MATFIRCDNEACGKSVEEANDDELIFWIVVGFRDCSPADVCSIECAKAILDDTIASSIQAMLAETNSEQEPANT